MGRDKNLANDLVSNFFFVIRSFLFLLMSYLQQFACDQDEISLKVSIVNPILDI